MKIELWIKREHLFGDDSGFLIDCAGEGDAISDLCRNKGFVLLTTVDVDMAAHRASSAKSELESLEREEVALKKQHLDSMEKLAARKAEIKSCGDAE